MTFFFDMNLSPRLAKGMRDFGEEVEHLLDTFAPHTSDEIWLADVGRRGLILVTRDNAIRRRPAELAALKAHDVGAFFLAGKSLGHCDLIRQVVRNWARMKELATRTSRPFAFRVPPQGSKITRIPL